MDTLKIIVGVIIAVFIIRYIVKKYNTLSVYREPVRKTLADIDTYKAQKQNTLQRLYEITEQFSQQERNIHMQTTLANMSRSRANFQALAATYPDLKSNQTYISLMYSVETLEHNIQNSQKLYHEAVSKYQTVRSQIPYCFFALLFGFKTAEYNSEKEPDTTLAAELTPPSPPLKPTTTSLAAEYHCPNCHAKLQQKTGKFGTYWRCENKKCNADFTDQDNKPVIIPCPDCHNGYLHKRKLGSQEYWTCSNYPNCKAKYPVTSFPVK